MLAGVLIAITEAAALTAIALSIAWIITRKIVRKEFGRIAVGDRATRPTDQAAARPGDTASVPCAGNIITTEGD